MRISVRIAVAAAVACALAAVAASTSLALSSHKTHATTLPENTAPVPLLAPRSKPWLQPFGTESKAGWKTFLLPPAIKFTSARPASLSREMLASHEVSCTPPTLTGRLKVVGLTAEGVACARAKTLAGRVARQLLKTGSVSLPEAASLEMSSSAPCASCVGTTDARILEPSGGEVSVTVRGKTRNVLGGTQLLSPSLNWPLPIPMPLPAPVAPAPSSGGSGTLV